MITVLRIPGIVDKYIIWHSIRKHASFTLGKQVPVEADIVKFLISLRLASQYPFQLWLVTAISS